MITKETKILCLQHGLKISEKVAIVKGVKLRFEAPVILARALTIGRDTSIGACTYFRTGTIASAKSIGRYCSFGPDISIGESNHPLDWLSSSPFQYNDRFNWYKGYDQLIQCPMTLDEKKELNKTAPTIGCDVWVGGGAKILRGVTIGNGAVIAAGAIINRDVEPFQIVGGVPGKVIKYRFPEEIRAALNETRWWDYLPHDLSGINFRDVEKAINEIRRRKEAGDIQPRRPAWKTYIDGAIQA